MTCFVAVIEVAGLCFVGLDASGQDLRKPFPCFLEELSIFTIFLPRISHLWIK